MALVIIVKRSYDPIYLGKYQNGVIRLLVGKDTERITELSPDEAFLLAEKLKETAELCKPDYDKEVARLKELGLPPIILGDHTLHMRNKDL